MTKLEALEKSITVWKWMFDNNDSCKATAYAALGFEYEQFYCSLCTFSLDELDANYPDVARYSNNQEAMYKRCQFCPVKWHDSAQTNRCTHPGSPYLDFNEARICSNGDTHAAIGAVLQLLEDTRKEVTSE